jgi:hypothetical protein
MNTLWSSLGTLVSLMMGAGNLASEGMLDLMMGIEVGDAIGTRDAMALGHSVNLLSLLVQIMVRNSLVVSVMSSGHTRKLLVL